MANFNDACSVLLLGHPFYGSLLMKMEHIEDRNLNPPTAAVNKRQLRYHPDFFAQLDLDEGVFVIAHEVMHQAWEHLPRIEYYLKTGIGPDGHPLDLQLFNMALDYPINHTLSRSEVGKFPAKIGGCLDPQRFPDTMTPEEIYCELRKDQQQGKAPKGKPMDDHDTESFAGEASTITAADIVEAAEQHKKIRGEYPAGMERLLGEIKRPDVSPWRRLRQFIVKSLPGFDASSWRRLQRKLVVRGIGVPGRVAHGAGTIGVVVDTSGSIDEEMLQLFGGHLSAIMTDAKPEKVLVYWTDAQVHRVDTVKTPSDLRRLLSGSVPGGGGTDMPKGVRAAEKGKCDGIVVLTDGYTPFTDSKKPLLWAITSHNITADHGITIHI